MADYAKAFSYDARGCSVDSVQGRIDTDVSAFLTSVSATHFNDITVSVNDGNVVVMVICDDNL